MGFSELTEEQKNIIQESLNLREGETLVVNSVAGSGKTTTLKKIAEALTNEEYSVCLTAFNVSIASEIKKSMLGGEQVCTFHALVKDLAKGYISLGLDEDPIRAAVNTLQNRYIRYPVKQLVTAMINEGYGLPGQDISPHAIFKKRGISKPKKAKVEDIVKAAVRVFETLVYKYIDVNFDLLLWNFCYLLASDKIELTYIKDFYLIDEFQDFNWVQLEILRLIQNKTNCRIIFVGDENQAIYQFRGACEDTLDMIYQMFKVASVCSLSFSFRCSGEVLKLAQKHVTRIKGSDSPGEVKHCTKAVMLEAVKEKDAIISRFNKDLVETALALLAKGVNIYLTNTNYFSEVFGQLTYSNFASFSLLYSWVETEVENAKDLEDPSARSARLDFIEVVKILAEKIIRKEETLTSLKNKITTSNKNNDVVTLTTIHRAKGLEWDNVYFLGYVEFNDRLKTQAEINAMYVGITRAVHTLYLL